MNQNLKVLSISTSDSIGGAARASYRIHLSVREFGIDSRMLGKEKKTLDESVIELNDFVPKSVFYNIYIWFRNKVQNKWQHFLWGRYPNRCSYYMSDLRASDIGGILKAIDYDIIHLHWVNLRFFPLDKLPRNKPVIWTLHDSWAFCGVCHYFLECNRYQTECGFCPHLHSDVFNDLAHRVWLQKKAIYNKLDLYVVSPSRWLGECAKKSSLLGEFPVTIIPNCLHIDLFRPVLRDCISPRWQSFLERVTDKPLVLYGAMNASTDRIKGYSNLLSALQILEKRGKRGQFELIVFGADKPLEELSISTSVYYVGYVKDEFELASLYSIASVMVVPSLTENLSCVIMESMACGTPVVAFDIGGNGDMIDHKTNGYLAKKDDNEDLADGILWCLDNLRECRLSEKARQKVVESFSPEVVGKKYLDLYNNVINSRSV